MIILQEISIFEVEPVAQLSFLVEEYLPGGDLQKVLNENPGQAALTVYRLTHAGRQIASVLMQVHQQNLSHGNLKPSNICLRNRETLEITLVDFGLDSFLEGRLRNRKELLPTLAYLPPERTGFVKMAGDAPCDLYSLGVTSMSSPVVNCLSAVHKIRKFQLRTLIFYITSVLGFRQQAEQINSESSTQLSHRNFCKKDRPVFPLLSREASVLRNTSETRFCGHIQ